MKISVQKIVRSFDLGEYAEEYRDQKAVFWVWVNPPRELRLRYDAAATEFEKAMHSLEDIARESRSKGTAPDLAALQELQGSLEKVALPVYGCLSELWSQAEDGSTGWAPQEVEKLARELVESDPPLWNFIVRRTFGLIRDHLEGARKN